MSYEINIISVGQTEPTSGYYPQGVELKNEVDDEGLVGRYSEIWPVFSSTKGILYSVGAEWDCGGVWDAFPLCDSDFAHPLPRDSVPGFLPERASETLTPLLLFSRYLPGVEGVVRRLVRDSPRKTILFQTRYQGGDWELFYGALTVEEFIRRLREGRLLFNVCYLVAEPDDKANGMRWSLEDDRQKAENPAE